MTVVRTPHHPNMDQVLAICMSIRLKCEAGCENLKHGDVVWASGTCARVIAWKTRPWFLVVVLLLGYTVEEAIATTYSNILFGLPSQQLNSFRSYRGFGAVLGIGQAGGPLPQESSVTWIPFQIPMIDWGATLVPQRRQVDIKKALLIYYHKTGCPNVDMVKMVALTGRYDLGRGVGTRLVNLPCGPVDRDRVPGQAVSFIYHSHGSSFKLMKRCSLPASHLSYSITLQ